ncbi:CD99 molecule isoform X2 [Denticeps clupeoides]|uniref:CD99 molecule isoform X2 n=1 Tax=Denticeps clupeoides TaxID=299321 RepID=UPI0010A2F091|nr:CD99 antigen-like protein 2 isoform X2 [Denticeps clupeoides]
MRSYFWLVFLACVVSTRAQGFDLGDALEDLDDPKPKATTKAPEVPKKSGTGDFDILDALGDDGKAPPKKPSGGGLDLEDALLPGPEPKKPVIPPKVDGGKGGNFDDSDLDDVVNGDSGYKPEGGKGKAGGTAYDHAGGSSEGTSQDLALPWTQILKMLGDNVPEGLHVWIDNFKSVFEPLLERLLEVLDVAQGAREE